MGFFGTASVSDSDAQRQEVRKLNQIGRAFTYGHTRWEDICKEVERVWKWFFWFSHIVPLFITLTFHWGLLCCAFACRLYTIGLQAEALPVSKAHMNKDWALQFRQTSARKCLCIRSCTHTEILSCWIAGLGCLLLEWNIEAHLAPDCWRPQDKSVHWALQGALLTHKPQMVH